ncbi:DUF4294 domain-containing protein [bacterium SCSIO 12741]|nr:DUF4294 domain-containing protein [bacterium SCSIO 12741]
MKGSVILLFLLALIPALNAQNQQAAEDSDGQVVVARVQEGDTVPQVFLNTYFLWEYRSFTTEKERKKYNKLQRNVKKVYPYARKAADLLAKYEDELEGVEDRKTRKKYYKKVEEELWDEYGDEISNLTVSQGRILIKLIDRETDRTSYELVKDLRSGFTAFVFQGMARLFGHNLKSEYNSATEDQYIEEIVVALEHGRI